MFDFGYVLAAIIAVGGHGGLAIWYTRRQRIRFDRDVDTKLAAFKTQLNETAGDAAAVHIQLDEWKKSGIAVALPEDFDSRIQGSIQNYMNGERSKTHAAVAKTLKNAPVGDDELEAVMELVAAQVDEDTARKLRAALIVARRAAARGWLGEHARRAVTQPYG